VETSDPESVSEMVRNAQSLAKAQGYVADGEKFIVVAGVPFKQPGGTNMLRIVTAGEDSTAVK
jgi:pyruvate kinase